jgi:hypothetical protein
MSGGWRLAALWLVALPGCALGLTTSMWNAQRSEPLRIVDAVLSRNGVVVADVDTTVGPLRLSKPPDASTDMLEVGDAEGALPDGRAIVVLGDGLTLQPGAPEPPSPSGAWIALGPSGRHDGQLVLKAQAATGFRTHSLWYRRPVDFGRWQAWGAVVATPVTFVLDVLVIGPTEFVWTIFTRGEHGPLFPFDGA